MPRQLSQSYLLRLWREHATAPLRATLITVGQPDEQQHFANLDALYAFLTIQTNQASTTGKQDMTDCIASDAG